MANERYGYFPYEPLPKVVKPSTKEGYTLEDIQKIIEEETVILRNMISEHVTKTMLGHKGHGIAEDIKKAGMELVPVYQAEDGKLFSPKPEIDPDELDAMLQEKVPPIVTPTVTPLINNHAIKVATKTTLGHVKADNTKTSANPVPVCVNAQGTLFIDGDMLVTLVKPSGDTTGATDYTNINNALAGGGKVELDEGTFYTNDTFILSAGSSVTGRDRSKSIIRATTNKPIFHNPNSMNFTIRDITMYGRVAEPQSFAWEMKDALFAGIQMGSQYVEGDIDCCIVVGNATNNINGRGVIENVSIYNFPRIGIKCYAHAKVLYCDKVSVTACGSAFGFCNAQNEAFITDCLADKCVCGFLGYNNTGNKIDMRIRDSGYYIDNTVVANTSYAYYCIGSDANDVRLVILKAKLLTFLTSDEHNSTFNLVIARDGLDPKDFIGRPACSMLGTSRGNIVNVTVRDYQYAYEEDAVGLQSGGNIVTLNAEHSTSATILTTFGYRTVKTTLITVPVS